MKTFSGHCGFAALLDGDTTGTAKGLARAHIYQADFIAGRPYLPLFDGLILNITQAWVEETLTALRPLEGIGIRMHAMYLKNRTSVYWELEHDERIVEAHRLALALLAPFLDTEAVDVWLLPNLSYKPRLLLAHHEAGIQRPVQPQFEFQGTIARVVFARFAPPGRIGAVLMPELEL